MDAELFHLDPVAGFLQSKFRVGPDNFQVKSHAFELCGNLLVVGLAHSRFVLNQGA
jgi:hypothetical protein